jgi:protein TonB
MFAKFRRIAKKITQCSLSGLIDGGLLLICMKTQKKIDVAYLDKYRGIFFQIGLIVVLCFVFFAIEWDTQPSKRKNITQTVEEPAKQIVFTGNPPIDKIVLPQPLQLVPYEIKVEDSNVQIDDEIQINPNFSQDFTVRPIELPPRTQKEEKGQEDKVFVTPEEMPLFNGGSSNTFRDWIQKNIRYPDIASENGIKGNVLISFVINSKGEVCDVKVLRGIDPSLDKEAVRIISSSPKWTPGKQSGKNVKVIFNFTVRFVLQN